MRSYVAANILCFVNSIRLSELGTGTIFEWSYLNEKLIETSVGADGYLKRAHILAGGIRFKVTFQQGSDAYRELLKLMSRQVAEVFSGSPVRTPIIFSFTCPSEGTKIISSDITFEKAPQGSYDADKVSERTIEFVIGFKDGDNCTLVVDNVPMTLE